MEKSTTIIDAQTSLLRELRETYVAIAAQRVEKTYMLRGDSSSDESSAATVAILRSIEKLALAVLLSHDDDGGWTHVWDDKNHPRFCTSAIIRDAEGNLIDGVLRMNARTGDVVQDDGSGFAKGRTCPAPMTVDLVRPLTQQIEPPAAEICKVTHDVVRIRNERNGQPGWENHAAAFCGISPEKVIEVWDAAVAKAAARPIVTEVKLTQTDTIKYPSDTVDAKPKSVSDDIIAEADVKPKFAEANAKPKLAVGQTWRTRSGEVGVIDNKSNSRFFCRFGPDRVRSYDADGDYGPVPSELDLVELIIDEDTNATD